MVLIVCVDEGMGMAFNNRRQSKDSVLRKRLMAVACGKRFMMNEYSVRQFTENTELITVDEDFLVNAQNGDYCFAETELLAPYEQKTEKIILYKWNRAYPSDMKLDICLDSWTLVSSFEFKGSSHEKITEEVYVREQF